jgi:hypothetical protein
MVLEDFFLSDLSQGSSPKLYSGADDLFRFFLDGFSFYGFPTDSSGKQAPFYA